MFQNLNTIIYQVSDIVKAKEWYSKILNKDAIFDSQLVVVFEIGGSLLTLLTNTNSIAHGDERVVAYWSVEDIDITYKQLIEYGATPSGEIIKTVLNTKIAKVIDPFGNILGITSKTQDKKISLENQPSETAMLVAFCRALAVNDERKDMKGQDYLAEIFLTDDRKKVLKDKVSREFVITKMITIELYNYFIARTVYIDNIFKKAIEENISQIVILGAGYDTRAYRFSKLIKETKIFELDIQPTQKYKLEMLNKSNIFIPSQLNFIAIDFNKEKIEDVLTTAGFDRNKKTFFIWEGVFYYLPIESVINTLKSIKLISSAGSSICFDYMTKKMQSYNPGETFNNFIESDKIESFLSELGYKIIEHLTQDDIEKRFLTLSNGDLAGNIPDFFCFVHATISR